jgi:acetyl-CoA synthetase
MSNIGNFQQQHHFKNYAELFAWSNNKREDFWREAIAAVDIRFHKKYDRILDLTHGNTMPNWLVGAEYNIVASCFKADPHKIAIIYQTVDGIIQKMSYSELQILTNRVSNSLQQLKLPPGAAIAIDMLMCAEAIAIYLGIIQAGFVAVGIADSFAAVEVARRLAISDAKLIFTQDIIIRDGKRLELYEKLAELPLPMIVLPYKDAELCIKLRAGDSSWHDFLLPIPMFVPVVAKPHDPINILFSSGTTGEPKAIVWDHTSPIKCAVDGYFYQDIQARDIVAWPTSLGWMMGPWLVFATLINSATLALFYDVPTSRKFTEFIAKTKVTILGVVPSLVKAWRSKNALDNLNWSHIKLFASTGETSNAADMQFLMRVAGDKPVIEYCGGTEISGAYITSTVLHENIPATFATPTLGLDLLLLDEEQQISDVGTVAIIGPSIGLSRELLNRDNFKEYYAEMPKTREGIIMRRHGDQMQRLANGYYKSLGRSDDAMNLGGIKVSAAEIEQSLPEIPGIIEAVAIAKNNPDAPTELIIFIVVDSKMQLDLNQVKSQMQNAINVKLNPLFKISGVRIIDTIPRTSSNKIMRRVLRELALQPIVQ